MLVFRNQYCLQTDIYMCILLYSLKSGKQELQRSHITIRSKNALLACTWLMSCHNLNPFENRHNRQQSLQVKHEFFKTCGIKWECLNSIITLLSIITSQRASTKFVAESTPLLLATIMPKEGMNIDRPKSSKMCAQQKLKMRVMVIRGGEDTLWLWMNEYVGGSSRAPIEKERKWQPTVAFDHLCFAFACMATHSSL